MNKKLIRLTESDLHRIVRESVNKVLTEDYYSMNRPYGNRKLSDYSSEDSKKLNDYDKGFGVWQKHNFGGGEDTFEPAPLGNIPNNEPEFAEDEQPYQYWRSLRDYEERMPIDPSDEDKKFQMDRDWHEQDLRDNYFDYSDSSDRDYNYNIHSDAFDASGANGRVTRLDSFDDTSGGRKARKFNGTLNSLRRKE